MSEQQIYPIYESPLLSVKEFHLDGTRGYSSDEDATDNHEIELMRSGMFVQRDALGTHAVDANHILIFERGQPFEFDCPVDCYVKSTIITPSEPVLINMLSHFDESVVDNPQRPFPHTVIAMDMRLQMLQKRILHLIEYNQQFDSIVVDELLLMLLAQILQTAFDPMQVEREYSRYSTYNAHRDLVFSVKTIINTQFRDELTLDAIAQQVHYSPFALARLFKRHTQLSIYQYVIRLRLLHSLEELLAYPQQSIGQIGINLGFNTPSHFSTAFLNSFGLTPSTFRQIGSLRLIHEMGKNLKVSPSII